MQASLLIQTRRRIIAEGARLLMQPLDNYVVRVPNDVEVLKRTLRKGDILLVEGNQRISQVIRYLTQSSWSHCAIYVGDALVRNANSQAAWARQTFGDSSEHLLVEALEGSGVTVSPIDKYVPYNIRICRPERLRPADVDRVIEYVCERIGDRYDLRHIVDLARYFFPVSIVPRRWRRAALTLGRNSERAVICSTMIARALGQVGYPILPEVTVEDTVADPPGLRRLFPLRRWQPQRARFRRRDPKLVTPRDFDLSPYFQIVKYDHLTKSRLDYQSIVWDEDTPKPEPVAAIDPPRASKVA